MSQSETVNVHPASGAVVTISRAEGDDKLQNVAFPSSQTDMFKFNFSVDNSLMNAAELHVEVFAECDVLAPGQEPMHVPMGCYHMISDTEGSLTFGRPSAYSEEDQERMTEIRYNRNLTDIGSIYAPQEEHRVFFKVWMAHAETNHRQCFATSPVFPLQLEQEVPDGVPFGPTSDA